jgi:hypothetical protein
MLVPLFDTPQRYPDATVEAGTHREGSSRLSLRARYSCRDKAGPNDACEKKAGRVSSQLLVRYRGTDYSMPRRGVAGDPQSGEAKKCPTPPSPAPKAAGKAKWGGTNLKLQERSLVMEASRPARVRPRPHASTPRYTRSSS